MIFIVTVSGETTRGIQGGGSARLVVVRGLGWGGTGKEQKIQGVSQKSQSHKKYIHKNYLKIQEPRGVTKGRLDNSLALRRVWAALFKESWLEQWRQVWTISLSAVGEGKPQGKTEKLTKTHTQETEVENTRIKPKNTTIIASSEHEKSRLLHSHII